MALGTIAAPRHTRHQVDPDPTSTRGSTRGKTLVLPLPCVPGLASGQGGSKGEGGHKPTMTNMRRRSADEDQEAGASRSQDLDRTSPINF
jgi:hypothetical protein